MTVDNSYMLSETKSTDMNSNQSLESRLARALTEKSELEVSYMQKIAFLENGKGKIINELKRMLNERDESVQEMQLKIKEIESRQNSMQEVSQNARMVSPEKQRISYLPIDDEESPEDENLENLRELKISLEEKDDMIKSLKEKVKQLSLNKPKQESPSSNKYGEKMRVAKANKRVAIIDRQLKQSKEELDKAQKELDEVKKKESETRFELSAREVAIKLLAETKDKEIVGKVAEELINNIDKQLKEYSTISDGDLIQSLAIVIATRIHISPFDNTKMINLMNQLIKNGLVDIKNGKISKIGMA